MGRILGHERAGGERRSLQDGELAVTLDEELGADRGLGGLEAAGCEQGEKDADEENGSLKHPHRMPAAPSSVMQRPV